jgi:hypothetical protein
MTMERIQADSVTYRRLPMELLGGYALLALLLVCTGIYGMLSFVSAGRTQELGVRAALGASRGDLVRSVLAGVSVPVLVGIALGLGGAVGLTRFTPVDALCRQPAGCDESGNRRGVASRGRVGGMLGARLASRASGPDIGSEARVEWRLLPAM